jgi:membrane-bound serine protease (ClpP class)
MKKSIRKKSLSLVTLVVSILTFLSFFPLSLADTTNMKVYVIPVSGEIDPGMFAYINRAINNLPKGQDKIVVFEMDTFGGRVDSALQIVEAILAIKDANTVAYVKTKAISAGALISLSCKNLVMKPGTTIGDCAPITYSGEGPKMLGEKFQSPLRAKFRSLARINGYNETLSEAMVSEDIEIVSVLLNNQTTYYDTTEFEELPDTLKKEITAKKTVVKKGELLTMDDQEALQLGFSRMSADSLKVYLDTLDFLGYEIIRVEPNLTEKMLLLLIKISPILMAIGLGAVYTEIKAPGFGAPGIIGIICLSLAIVSQNAAGLAGYTEVLLIVLGFVLIGFEFFVIPGFGIAGISGFLFIVAGLVLSLQGFTLPDPKFPWQADILTGNFITIVYCLAGSALVSLFFLKLIIPRMGRVVSGPYLAATLADAHADSDAALKVHPGLSGIAETYLRPSGKMVAGNDYYDVITDGEFIEKGTEIVVLKVRGNTVVVQKKTGNK